MKKKKQILMSKPVYLGLSILELSIHKDRRHLHRHCKRC